MKKLLILAGIAAVGAANAQLFANPAPITIPDSGVANPYPSTIAVSGVVGVIGTGGITVTLNAMSHTFPDDIDILLVGPTGAMSVLMSDAGGSLDIVGVTLGFNQLAVGTLPDSAQIVSGVYKPVNYGTGDTYPPPAPAGGSTATANLDNFNALDPNGTWGLYVVDDLGGDMGAIDLGWSIEFTPIPEPTTMLAVGAGLAALAARRRRK